MGRQFVADVLSVISLIEDDPIDGQKTRSNQIHIIRIK